MRLLSYEYTDVLRLLYHSQNMACISPGFVLFLFIICIDRLTVTIVVHDYRTFPGIWPKQNVTFFEKSHDMTVSSWNDVPQSQIIENKVETGRKVIATDEKLKHNTPFLSIWQKSYPSYLLVSKIGIVINM